MLLKYEYTRITSGIFAYTTNSGRLWNNFFFSSTWCREATAFLHINLYFSWQPLAFPWHLPDFPDMWPPWKYSLKRCETHSQFVSLAPLRAPLKLSLLHSIVFQMLLRTSKVTIRDETLTQARLSSAVSSPKFSASTLRTNSNKADARIPASASSVYNNYNIDCKVNF